eukprot:ctg_3695.g722
MLWNGSWRQVVQKWRTSAWPSGTWLGDDGAEQGHTEEVALDDGETSLRASERLLVRLRTHDGRYLAVQASSAEATATTPPLEVVSRRRARHNAASTIFILRKSPPGHHDAPSWAWSDRLSRPLHLLVPGGAAPPRLVVLAEPADDAHLQLELEQAAVDAVRRADPLASPALGAIPAGAAAHRAAGAAAAATPGVWGVYPYRRAVGLAASAALPRLGGSAHRPAGGDARERSRGPPRAPAVPVPLRI